MKGILLMLCCWLCLIVSNAQSPAKSHNRKRISYRVLKTESRIAGLQVALLHQSPKGARKDLAVLILHGSYLGAEQSSGYRMNGYSWLDNLSENGYDVYALDYLGYGSSDRYPELSSGKIYGNVLGQAKNIYKDVDKAVDYILKRTGKSRLLLIGHSWGGSVAALYAEKFPAKIAKLVLYSALIPTNDSSVLQQFDYTYVRKTPQDLLEIFKSWTPAGKQCLLEDDFISHFGRDWLHSDPLAIHTKSDSVTVPSGAQQDIEDMAHSKSYYTPENISAPTLLIRGEYDDGPNYEDYVNLFNKLVNTSYKKYVIVPNGTHIIHLEKERFAFYKEILSFLQSKQKDK